jgi:hypothetical protein
MNSLINRIFIYFYFVLLLLLLLYKKSKYNSVEGFQGGIARDEIEVKSRECRGISILFQSFIHEKVGEGGREGGRERSFYEDLIAVCLSVCLYGGVLFSFSSSASVLTNIKILFGDLYAKCRKVRWLFSQFIKDTLLLWLRMVCHCHCHLPTFTVYPSISTNSFGPRGLLSP